MKFFRKEKIMVLKILYNLNLIEIAFVPSEFVEQVQTNAEGHNAVIVSIPNEPETAEDYQKAYGYIA